MKDKALVTLRRKSAKTATVVLASLVALLSSPPAQSEVVSYYHVDPQGSVRAATDSAGTVLERHDYYPYGEECETVACGNATGLNAAQPLRFTGKERDKETGLDYFGARYYGSRVARFTTADTFSHQEQALQNPQLWNRYAYANNNPYRYVDPDGRWIVPALIAAVVVYAVLTAPDIANAPGPSDPVYVSDQSGQLYMQAAKGVGRVMGVDYASTAELAIQGMQMAGNGSSTPASDWAQLAGQLQEASRGKGNFGVGSATSEQADAMGKAWVGEGFTRSSNGTILISADGSRQYRPPSDKKKSGRRQANLEWKNLGPDGKPTTTEWQGNAHITIEDP